MILDPCSSAAGDAATPGRYWEEKLGGVAPRATLPSDRPAGWRPERARRSHGFALPADLSAALLRLANDSESRLHVILLAGAFGVLHRYTAREDIVVGTPPYAEDAPPGGGTILPIRCAVRPADTFRELTLRLRETVAEALDHQDEPLPGAAEVRGAEPFGVVLRLEGLHGRPAGCDDAETVLSFSVVDRRVHGVVEYDPSLHSDEAAARGARHLVTWLGRAVERHGDPLGTLEMLDGAELDQLLVRFNDTAVDFGPPSTLHGAFESQARRTPDAVAVSSRAGALSYRELDADANRIARLLRRDGVERGSVVAVLAERSPLTLAAMLGAMKAGAAYLPIDPGTPAERVRHMLDAAGAAAVVTDSATVREYAFPELRNLAAGRGATVRVNPPRRHLATFGQLPAPDRSLIDLRRYRDKIGMASVTHCMAVQSTRGCPYTCLFCHRLWSKHHVARSAESIFEEVAHYAARGVVNFAFIDDAFNLNVANCERFFRLVVKSGLVIQLFFPNGLRGDLLTPSLIDLMAEAGTRGINLSLETASPRLQRLLQKNLDVARFREVVDYIATRHPEIMLEMATMHGFPSETEEEARLTLDFIKSVRWLHFPYVHILKIFPGTDMERFALAHGISPEDIRVSKDRAFHELPETLPFPKSFTRKYQAEFMNEYFLSRERLSHVLPRQLAILSETAIVQKYNAYLPVPIASVADLVKFAQLDPAIVDQAPRASERVPELYTQAPATKEPAPDGRRVLLLDLSQHFSSHEMLYKVSEQPIGLVYLLTDLRRRFGDRVAGRIYKSGVDFDSFAELEALVKEWKPDLVGIRTLTFFSGFFHETVSLLRRWGVTAPIVTGGPYASSDAPAILQDRNVDAVVVGEGEQTLAELVEALFANDFRLPAPDALARIDGLAFRPEEAPDPTRPVLVLDTLGDALRSEDASPLGLDVHPDELAYVMFTSGSTGKPKAIEVEHRQAGNCIEWMQHQFPIAPGERVVQRTNLAFDPSVWELFWPLRVGAESFVLDAATSRDPAALVDLMAEGRRHAIMYCPASLLTEMARVIERGPVERRLDLRWLLTGAEPVGRDVIDRIYARHDGAVVNTYGPTECAINNTFAVLPRQGDGRPVPIGTPIANNRVYVLGPDLRPAPLHAVGELFIAGDSVSRGYRGAPEETRRAFLENPFGPGRLYRTGDLGRWLEEGTLEILGRADDQLKLRGYRIETGEVEAALRGHPEVSECVVVARSTRGGAEERACKRCGASSRYPGVRVDEDGVCKLCRDLPSYRDVLAGYFGTLDDLDALLRTARRSDGAFDAAVLFAGGRAATYALRRLAGRGLRLVALTYDNGYFGARVLERIRSVTQALGVEHVVLRHESSDAILRESLKIGHHVCRGCFHGSSALAGEWAMKNGVPVVIGTTLSRGQIIENRLLHHLEQGVRSAAELEQAAREFQRGPVHEHNRSIFQLIDRAVIDDRSVYDRVQFVDFYRYCDVTRSEMLADLEQMAEHWRGHPVRALYSTNCPIKQIGDRVHLDETGHHYYGGATFWERRLGHLSANDVQEELGCKIASGALEAFMRRIAHELPVRAGDDRHLCAYVTGNAGSALDAAELRRWVRERLPTYMVPSFIVPLRALPLNASGKVDRNALPAPSLDDGDSVVEPRTDVERQLREIWAELLELEPRRIGIESNFFDLGGHSLKMALLAARIIQEPLADLPKDSYAFDLGRIMRSPTIHGIAQYVQELRDGRAPAAGDGCAAGCAAPPPAGATELPRARA